MCLWKDVRGIHLSINMFLKTHDVSVLETVTFEERSPPGVILPVVTVYMGTDVLTGYRIGLARLQAMHKSFHIPLKPSPYPRCTDSSGRHYKSESLRLTVPATR